MKGKKIVFKVNKRTLVGKILGKKTDRLSNFIFFHGAGKSTKEKAKKIFSKTFFIAVSNIVTFDFSGHGESAGKLKESSLQKRILEAKKAIEIYTTGKNLTICGSSMGGYVALKMLEFYDVKNIILFAPAIYDKQAINVQFNKGFTKIIRKRESWRNSDVIPLLKKFTGNLIIFIGENDEIITAEVIDLINKYSVKVKKKEIIKFKNCPHAIHNWLDKHPIKKEFVNKKIIEYYFKGLV